MKKNKNNIMRKIAEFENYAYYVGMGEKQKPVYNISPKDQPAPKGGYYAKEYILGIKRVPDLFSQY